MNRKAPYPKISKRVVTALNAMGFTLSNSEAIKTAIIEGRIHPGCQDGFNLKGYYGLCAYLGVNTHVEKCATALQHIAHGGELLANRDVLEDALMRSDWDFFIKLGEAVKKRKHLK